MAHIHTDWRGEETRGSWGIPAERYLNKRDGFGSRRLQWACMLEYENSVEIQASLGIRCSKNKSSEPSCFNNRK